MSDGVTVLSFRRGVEFLRGLPAEAARERRIAIQRQAAYRRAVADDYAKADEGLFGPAEALIRSGPGFDPRLAYTGIGPAAA